MGKTFKTFKGEVYKAKDLKKRTEKKYFGNTSGTHSKKQNGAAIKGEDFIKYGWPFETRKGKVLKNLQKERDSKLQLKAT
jgi:hypothetical protein